jgi:hypothetical protein
MEEMPVLNPQKVAASPESVLCKALLNTKDELGLTQAELGAVIGLDRTSVSRLKDRAALNPLSKEGELAAYLIRIYRSLYALVGGDRNILQHWIRTENKHLQGRPIELMQHIQGLVRVLEYLDAMRGKV